MKHVKTKRNSKKTNFHRKEIHSETIVLLQFFKAILLLPIALISFMLGIKTKKDIANPIQIISEYVTQAKFTFTIILINIVIFFTSLFFPRNWIEVLAISPSNLLNGRIYTLITSGFLHANLAHLMSNMIFIFIFGRILERKFGSNKTGLIYFGAMIISGFFSSVIYFIMGKDILGIGASGALMGLVAAAILLDPFYITYVMLVPMPVMIIGWIAIYGDIIGILTPIETNIGHLAHLGGFLSISVLMYLFKKDERENFKKGFLINVISLFVAIILFTIFRSFIL